MNLDVFELLRNKDYTDTSYEPIKLTREDVDLLKNYNPTEINVFELLRNKDYTDTSYEPIKLTREDVDLLK